MLQLSPVCIYEGLPFSCKWEQPVVTQPLKGEKKSQTCVIKGKEAISVRGMRRYCISGANTETMKGWEHTFFSFSNIVQHLDTKHRWHQNEKFSHELFKHQSNRQMWSKALQWSHGVRCVLLFIITKTHAFRHWHRMANGVGLYCIRRHMLQA